MIRPLATAVPVRAQLRQLLGVGSAGFSAEGSWAWSPSAGRVSFWDVAHRTPVGLPKQQARSTPHAGSGELR